MHLVLHIGGGGWTALGDLFAGSLVLARCVFCRGILAGAGLLALMVGAALWGGDPIREFELSGLVIGAPNEPNQLGQAELKRRPSGRPTSVCL